MCLQYNPTVVACVCIHLACKWSNWVIPPSREGKEWWWYVDSTVTLPLLEELTSEFLAVFEKCPSRLKKKTMAFSTKVGSGHPSDLQAHFSLDCDYGQDMKVDDDNSVTDGETKGVNRQVSQGPITKPDRTKVDLKEYREKREKERLERERQERLQNGQDVQSSNSKIKRLSPGNIPETKNPPSLNDTSSKPLSSIPHDPTKHHHHYHQSRTATSVCKPGSKVPNSNAEVSQSKGSVAASCPRTQEVVMHKPFGNLYSSQEEKVISNNLNEQALSKGLLGQDAPHREPRPDKQTKSESLPKPKSANVNVPVATECGGSATHITPSYLSSNLPSYKSLFGTPSPPATTSAFSPAWSHTSSKIVPPTGSNSAPLADIPPTPTQSDKIALKTPVSEKCNSGFNEGVNLPSHVFGAEDDKKRHKEKAKHKKKDRHKDKNEKYRVKYMDSSEHQSQNTNETCPSLVNQSGSGIRVKINLKSSLDNASVDPMVLSPVSVANSNATGTLKLKISKDLLNNLAATSESKRKKRAHSPIPDHGSYPTKLTKTDPWNSSKVGKPTTHAKPWKTVRHSLS